MEKNNTTKAGKKLGLPGIDVQSFVTTLNRDEQRVINGGSGGGQDEQGTLVPVFC